MSKIHLSLGLVVGFIAVSANAATIIEASGANDATLGVSSLGNYNAIAFSTTSDFTNVNISTTFVSFGGDAVWDVNAFLTTLLGPGTTAAGNEIASLSTQLTITDSPVTIPYTLTPQNLFSIPFLAAGSYYLSIYGTPVSGGTAHQVLSTAGGLSIVTAGASVDQQFLSANGIIDPIYAPASSFNASTDFGMWLSVTGDPVNREELDAPVPEPSAGLLALAGILALSVIRFRSAKKA